MALPTKWILKACPRCKGDMSVEYAYNELVCLQCGNFVMFDLDPKRKSELSRGIK